MKSLYKSLLYGKWKKAYHIHTETKSDSYYGKMSAVIKWFWIKEFWLKIKGLKYFGFNIIP